VGIVLETGNTAVDETGPYPDVLVVYYQSIMAEKENVEIKKVKYVINSVSQTEKNKARK
jgi:hypothetical protein